MGYFRLISKKSESPLLWDLSMGSHFLIKGGHGSAKWTQTSLICELGTWVYLKGYDLENLKKYVVASFWPPVAMETIQYGHQTQLFKKLKTTNHCMQINFLFTVSTNIILSSLLVLPRIFVVIMFFLYCIIYVLWL